MKKNNTSIFVIFVLLFIFGLICAGCENLTTDNDKTTDDSEVSIDTITENNGEEDVFDDNPMLSLKGTIWYADEGSLFIEFPNNHLILFRNYQNFGSIGGNLNGNVTLGNFRLSSYDGETMKLLDYDNLEVAFSVIVSENKMAIDGLNAIKWTAPPYQRRDYRSYNRTYTKGE
jgi:hypothetical protein